MRASKKPSSDDIRERYLGEIAPLLDAARHIHSLTEIQTRRVRKRIVRTLFRSRFLSFRVHLFQVLAALAMLVIGGAAFAMAERLGLLPKLGAKSPSAQAAEPTQEVRKRRGSGARPSVLGQVPGSPEAATVVLPVQPEPLLCPAVEASTTGWSLPSEARPPTPAAPARVVELGAVAPAADPIKPLRRPAKLMAYAAPTPVMTAPAPVMAAPSASLAGQAAPRETPAPARSVSESVQPARPLVPSLTNAEAAVSPAPAAAAPAVAAARPVAVAPMTRTVLGDQAMFGQAMRKLRMENNPEVALKVLQEHARFYPGSSLGGERSALEVEALLALHRDRDALAHLDTMALDELPRSGERFVVRGELRAAARRWLEASADFDQALTRVTGSPAWHERALWGRGAARLRCGEREAGMADLERYLDKYPSGRFAGQAAKFFPNR
jgi:hypothetical protein